MLELTKKWIPPTPTVVIDTTTGRHNVIRKREFTIGYGNVNTWSIDSTKTPAPLLKFTRTDEGLEVEPANPNDIFLLDGQETNLGLLQTGIEYTMQINHEYFLLQVTAKPMAWLGRIKLDKWLLFEPSSGNTYGPLDKVQLERWVLAEKKEPSELIYLPQGSSKGFYVNQLFNFELPAAVPQSEQPIEQPAEETTEPAPPPPSTPPPGEEQQPTSSTPPPTSASTPSASESPSYTPPRPEGKPFAPRKFEPRTYTPLRREETQTPDAAQAEKPYAPNLQNDSHLQSRCPHCWTPFYSGQLLSIACHESLRGDPVLGEDEMLRFKPKSYSDQRIALDAAGTPCVEKACPQCRLKIPHGLDEANQGFISLIGSPGAGKSYYLSVLINQLQRTAQEKWGLFMEDADPTANAALNSMRHKLVSAQFAADAYLAKTSLAGHLYSKVVLNGREVMLPKPFTYFLEGPGKPLQSLTFYDNAGEHFQPDSDGIANPVTHHLIHAHLWCFLFDPSKDANFRKHIKTSRDPQLSRRFPTESQELILAEMKNRLRVLHQVSPQGKLNTPLAFVIGKSDMLSDWEPMSQLADPWNDHFLDSLIIQKNSDILRKGLLEIAPTLVTRAESLSEKVVYFESTTFGHAPRRIRTGELSPIPSKLNPHGVEVPVLWWLSSWSSVFKNGRG